MPMQVTEMPILQHSIIHVLSTAVETWESILDATPEEPWTRACIHQIQLG